ncbi:SpoIIIAH-like family protein [Terrisporobacter sp.]|uniref:SpoIIIAH-like family protein n=1 Tax=Terrisporobacter sp. TaxID=1965305 RepID=UPI0026101E04|nr:SpoIIIAH-like family protein [Terrisporobacter sp.]
MKINLKHRGVVVISLSAMLIALGVGNYQLSKQSALTVSEEFEAYEQAQQDKNTDKEESKETAEITVVDSKDSEQSDIEEKAIETSKEIEEQLASKENMSKSTYILDMKMEREKQRNDLSEELNTIINNPSTSDESREEASNMKVQLVKYQETELKIENLLSAKGYEDALVYIGQDNVNVVVNKSELTKSDAAKIFDLVAEQAGVDYDKIKLTPNSLQK